MLRILKQERIPFLVIDFYSHLAKEIEKGRMLDLGCGRGKAMKPFFECGWDCVGVDINSEALKKASRYGQVILRKDEEPLSSLENESFDVITANAVFHHLKDINSNLSEVIRCLKRGGVFLLNEVVEDSFLMRSGRDIFKKWRGMPIYSRVYIRDWLDVFRRHNLKILRAYSQNHWVSFALMPSSFLPSPLKFAIRRHFTRKPLDLTAQNYGQIMFILFVLQR